MKGFQKTPDKDPVSRPRIYIFYLIVFAGILFCAYNLFSLQIKYGELYSRKAEEVARRTSIIPAQRGEIFDRNKDLPIVMNIDSFAVNIIPAEISREDWQNVLSRLAEVLEMDLVAVKRRIPPEYRHLYQEVQIKAGVPYETIVYLAERIEDYPGVSWTNKPVRSYLEVGSMSHILGYVGDITQEELQVLYNKGYNANTVLGKSGVEKYYDRQLRGKDGKRFRTVDVKGKKISSSVDEIPPVLGKSLVLTIDRNLQRICEQALGKRTGSVVVLKPASGEILAMVSSPWYDPNIFYTERSAGEFARLSTDPSFPFLNRAVQSSYPPASLFKIIMTSAILETEVFSEYKKINCRGAMRLGDRIFRCHKRSGHGPLNLKHALAESCDTYYWTVGGQYLGIDHISQFSQIFGLGSRTGIDLPGEVSGLVPSPEWKKQVYNSPWVGGDTLNVSIGQGFMTATPLQMANVVAMIVNEGKIYRPFLVKEFIDPLNGESLEKVKPEILHHAEFKDSTYEKVKEAMREVCVSGTARFVIQTPVVDVAAKTGTAEVGIKDRYHSWFSAYAPYSSANPEEQIIVTAMVEASEEYEFWAAIATNAILHCYFSGESFDEAVRKRPFMWQFRKQS